MDGKVTLAKPVALGNEGSTARDNRIRRPTPDAGRHIQSDTFVLQSRSVFAGSRRSNLSAGSRLDSVATTNSSAATVK